MTLDLHQNVREFKRELQQAGMTLKDFSHWYSDFVSQGEAELEDAEKLYQKLDKQLSDPPKRDKVTFCNYLTFFKAFYLKDNLYHKADRDAAWQFFVQLNTRIATKRLPDDQGQDKAALESLASLFEKDRAIREANGPLAKKYRKLVDQYFDRYLRPFTSKWHRLLSDENSQLFREELTNLQAHLKELCTILEQIADTIDKKSIR